MLRGRIGEVTKIVFYFSQVIEHIRSYNRDTSHYAREKTRDTQFLESDLTIAQLWRDFLKSKDVSSNDDLPLSYCTFRRIFRKFKLSFKKPYVDTCSKCDSLDIVIKYSQDEKEIRNAEDLKKSHIEKAAEGYDCFHFDLYILPKRKNTDEGFSNVVPLTWV